MIGIALTQYDGALLGPIARLLGYIINAIYSVMESVGIQNIGISIILFTVVVNVLLLPLTIKQQRTSKMTARMNPELQAIQKKYKGKRDSLSMQKMNEEMNAVYDKYGTSMYGGCLPLLIQMPILLALWRVISNIPAYVSSVKAMFSGAVTAITSISGYQDIIQQFVSDNKITGLSLNFATTEAAQNSIIDVLYVLKATQWDSFEKISQFQSIGGQLSGLRTELEHVNYFLGMNIAESPISVIQTAFATGAFLMIIGAIAVPLLSALTQWINAKLMPQAASGDESTANMMKSMNMTMPIMSAIFCLSFQIGLGIYWIASSVVRSVIQLIINKQLDKLSVDELIEKNMEKASKKREKKQGVTREHISQAARTNVKSIDPYGKRIANLQDLDYSKEVKPGSLAEKARMVQKFNEKNRK